MHIYTYATTHVYIYLYLFIYMYIYLYTVGQKKPIPQNKFIITFEALKIILQNFACVLST